MKLKLFCACCLMVALSCFTLQAQKSDSTKRLFCSFGIRANTFLLSDFNLQNMPPARLQLNIDPAKFLRIELQYGLSKTVAERVYLNSQGSYVKNELTNKTAIWSAGIFGLIKRERTNFYVGFRYGRVNYATDGLNYSTPNPYVETATGIVSMYSAVLGGEYFFARRFSVGGEFAFVSMKDEFTPPTSVYNYPSTTTTSRLCETSIIFRFYPF